jgi:predicted transcriptional regulator
MTTKTTLYLPDDLKRAVEFEAARSGRSEAEVIRAAIAAFVERPEPRGGLFEAEPFADRVDELLSGFGKR